MKIFVKFTLVILFLSFINPASSFEINGERINLTGVITDINGFFQLEHDHSNHQLVFRFVGYQPDTLDIRHDEEINVIMGEGKILDGFVVEYNKGDYTFSKLDPLDAHIITQGAPNIPFCIIEYS